jgi:hypothetical protein
VEKAALDRLIGCQIEDRFAPQRQHLQQDCPPLLHLHMLISFCEVPLEVVQTIRGHTRTHVIRHVVTERCGADGFTATYLYRLADVPRSE